ncbi:ribulokinase [Pseudoalteromonas gelatinilytica]|uniref:Ribulokinase n=1 Tax=Pseudoalteromonas gelatinilytica TaxID=1703256 RepID=A0A3A3EMF7_9GAMM|nr:ribulokinase [Pseudoalteromonas profundi]RJF33918.1 ribulokinase [Pseudoalteromonas profundi]
MSRYTLGLDYGSDSVRALLVDVATGEELASHLVNYPRWAQGLYCDPSKDQFRQHPQDYIDSLVEVVNGLWSQVPAGTADKVVGMSFDTTGSTPVAINSQGTPLALTEEFAENPNAMFILWKDHTSIKEANEITAAATNNDVNYLSHMGGIYSSEWYWAKALHIFRVDSSVKAATYSWVEHCDWMTALMCGTTHPEVLKLGRCATGHKQMWNEQWGGFPPNSFFSNIDPLLDGVVDTLNATTEPSDQVAGNLTAEWAEKLGLPQGIVVGYGAFDCHMGAVAANVRPGVLTKVMGTSTCDITVTSQEQLGDTCVKGICGQVDGSVIPGMVGLEAGQSAFGDLYAWFKNLVLWPTRQLTNLSDAEQALVNKLEDSILVELSKAAAALPVTSNDVTALDWVNGRRTPDADQSVAMALTGLKMGTDAPKFFKALVEATAFGARAITERFRSEGVPIESVVVIGGISKKSDYVMQTCADVWNCPIDVLESEQSCALGAAIMAAVAAGEHATVEDAQKVMASSVCHQYLPNPERVAVYDELYANYQALASYVNGDKA